MFLFFCTLHLSTIAQFVIDHWEVGSASSQTRQAIYVSNIITRRVRAVEKAVGITYSRQVSVALCIQHAMRMFHIVICGLSGFTTCFQIISYRARFSGEKKLLDIKCVLIFSTTSVSNIFHTKKR